MTDQYEPEDRVLRAAFWTDDRIWQFNAQERLLYVWLWCVADQDGIAPFDHADVQQAVATQGSLLDERPTRYMLGKLEAQNLVVIYDVDGRTWAWIATLRAHQPTTGKLRPTRDTTRPPPPQQGVHKLLEDRLGRPPTKAELKAASPRSYGLKRAPSGLPPSGDVRGVWEAWLGYQKHPELCNLGASRNVITGALSHTTATALIMLVRFAHEADDPGPRFWRGDNDRGQTYLGLQNLFWASKLASRLQMAKAWQQRQAKATEQEDGVDFGDYVTESQRRRLTDRWRKG